MSKTTGIGAVAGILLGMAAAVGAAEPLRATIELADSRSNVVFLVKANEQGILWQYTPDNPATDTTALADIVSIEFDDPEGWAEAVILYRSGKYAEAAPALGKIADDYVDIVTLEASPAAMARYLQLESLRKGGMYSELAAILTEETRAKLQAALDESLHLQLGLDAGWAAVGREDWEAVNALLAENTEDGHIKAMAPRYLTQFTFMRGLSRSAAGETKPAIDDFYRTATFGYGNDIEVSGQAIRRVMDLLVAEPEKLEANRTRLRQLHAATYLYKTMFGKGTVPAGFEEYAEVLPATEGGGEEGGAVVEDTVAEGAGEMPTDASAEGEGGEAPMEGEAPPAGEGGDTPAEEGDGGADAAPEAEGEESGEGEDADSEGGEAGEGEASA
ncbi:MAG: hypothetical protein AAF591_08560 [Verrucomicrobiota bacterium]